jgi:hypothetical protein
MKIKITNPLRQHLQQAKIAVYDRRKAYRERQKAKGLCVLCPEKLSSTSSNFCEYHQGTMNAFRRKYYSQSKAQIV